MTDCGKESVSCMEREQEQEKEGDWSKKPANSEGRAEKWKRSFPTPPHHVIVIKFSAELNSKTVLQQWRLTPLQGAKNDFVKRVNMKKIPQTNLEGENKLPFLKTCITIQSRTLRICHTRTKSILPCITNVQRDVMHPLLKNNFSKSCVSQRTTTRK